MKLSFWQRADHWARSVAPFGLCFLLIVVGLVPIRLPGYGPIMPWMLLVAVYFWALHRPDLLPPLAIFALGLLSDLLSGGQVGTSSLVLLSVFGVLRSQRLVILASSFLIQWAIFTFVALGAELLFYLANVVLLQQGVDPSASIFQFLMTVAVYPLLAWIFVLAQRSLLKGV